MSCEQSKTDYPAPSKNRKTLTLECKLNIIPDFQAQIKICGLANKSDLQEFRVRIIK